MPESKSPLASNWGLALCVLTLGVLLLSACGRDATSSTKSEGKRSITLQTNWAPQPEDGGFFHAAKAGLYAAEDLEVAVKPAAAGMNIYSYVAAGEADFGISVLAKLIVAIDRGLPLVAVASYRPASLRVLLLHDADPARDFPDLNNRVVKARGEDLWLKYLQRKYDLSLRVVPHDFGLGQFLAQSDLIQQGLLTSEPYTLQERGVPVRILELKDAGWENLEVIFCRRELLDSDPELARKIARASLLGWKRFLTEPSEETLEAMAHENPARSLDSMRWAKNALLQMYNESGVFESGEFGAIDPQRVEKMIANLVTLEAIDEAMPVDAVADFSVIESL